MDLSAQELWERVIPLLKEEIGAENIDLWLKGARPVLYNEQKFSIEVPNKFFFDWIKANCEKHIKKSVNTITNQDPFIDLVVSSQTFSEKEEIIEPLPTQKKEMAQDTFQFNPKYTFDSFVVGKSNRFAQAACEAVSKDPGEAYNPLFIYGGVGLGKTHLLHAIGNHAKQTNPHAKVLYITADKFMNELIEAIRRDRNIEFRQKYRSLDVLLIDDIQFLAGKESTQEEFFHTFNTLYEAHKQIVVSSDSSPKEIPTLEERLRSRFEWGVIADIQPPDMETRVAILRKKAEVERIAVSDEVLLFIGSKVKANIRELEGSLIRVAAFSLLTKSEITVDSAKDILKDIITKENPNTNITVEIIQKIVSSHFNLNVKDLTGKRRTDAIALPRQVAMYLGRTLTELSTTDIGDRFGGRDHSTVMYACEKIRKKTVKDPYFSALINKITQEIRAGE
ncbi:MAG: chromosomal replication initiator protein DnaA [Elusimicrobiota bacterium]